MVVLRVRGTFIDLKPKPWQDMTSDQVRKRSASAPPKVGAEPGATTDQHVDQYFAGLIERAAHLPLDVVQAKLCSERLVHASCGNEACDSPKSVSIDDVPELASVADLEFQLEDEDHPATPTIAEDQPITTLMFGGIPCHLSPQEIIDVIDEKGFSDDVDLFYVPPPPKTGRRSARGMARNLGYAFVNLKTPELATAFADAFNQFAFDNSSTKRCFTTPAQRQGFEANVKHHFDGDAAFHVCRR